MVLQDTWLFSDTIMENIRYGRLDATDEEVIEAAKAARVHRFVQTLPEGYGMVLNEDATNVSQGQKQLLTIATHDSGRPEDSDSRRGDQLGRYAHRGTDPKGDGYPDARAVPASSLRTVSRPYVTPISSS